MFLVWIQKVDISNVQMKCPKIAYTTKTGTIFMQNPRSQWYESI